jgi:hypothetical protein
VARAGRLATLALLLAGCAAPPPPASPPLEGPLYDGKPLSFYLQEVKDLNPDRRDRAAWALSYFGEAAAPAIPDLIATLAYRGIAGTGGAPDALLSIGPAALTAVEAAMFAPSEETRSEAAGLVAVFLERGLRTPTLVDSLTRALDDSGGAAAWAAWSFRLLGREAAPVLAKLEVMAQGKGQAAEYAAQTLKILKAGE